MRSMHVTVGCALVSALLGGPAAGSDHDIHFLSEHVSESAMDAHYLSLPGPAGRLEPGAWQPSVDFSAAGTTTELIDIGGPMIAFAAAGGVRRTSGAHLPSGLEFDLGGSVLFPATEHVSHAGVDRALVVHVAWRGNRARHAED